MVCLFSFYDHLYSHVYCINSFLQFFLDKYFCLDCHGARDLFYFCRAMRSIRRLLPSRGVRPSVCLSVCLSVTFVSCVKTSNRIFEIFPPSGSQTIIVFPYQTAWQYSNGNPANRGVKCRWGIGTNLDSGLIAGYRRLLDVRSANNSYRRPCSVDRTSRDRPAS